MKFDIGFTKQKVIVVLLLKKIKVALILDLISTLKYIRNFLTALFPVDLHCIFFSFSVHPSSLCAHREKERDYLVYISSVIQFIKYLGVAQQRCFK